ncbi:YncE family protein [Ideonella paludis]|uniref:YncE family protein n=1 Tax=Ideonella paludis TaxID=1233411 RepID=UPI0036373CF6
MIKSLTSRLMGWPQALGFAVVAVAAVVWPLASQSDTRPTEGTVNLETAHVHPLDVASDMKRLLVANTAAHTVEVYDSSDPRNPRHLAAIPVGLEPVSVRLRGTGEAWVVNQLSDSISIIDVYGLSVVRTLKTSNEPADVVFAGSRAFVSCADANVVEVFDLNNLAAAPQRVAIAGEEPRAMAVSSDGTKVYAAIFESGNGTTVLNGRSGDSINVVSRTEGPYQGQNPPPMRAMPSTRRCPARRTPCR